MRTERYRRAVRRLVRKPLGTSCTAVCDDLVSLFAKPPLTGTILAVDETGVGKPVVDLLDSKRIQADLRPITIAGGHEAYPGDGLGWKVPKECQVSTLQVLLQGSRITVAKQLPFAPALVEELQNFQVPESPKLRSRRSGRWATATTTISSWQS